MPPALAMTEIESQQICFRCHYVGLAGEIGARTALCPVCGFVLIVNSAAVALGRPELDEIFERRDLTPTSSSPTRSAPLPGISAQRRAVRKPLTHAKNDVVRAPVAAPPAPRRARRRFMRLLQEISVGGLLALATLLALGFAGVL
jgi:hypothetical protein